MSNDILKGGQDRPTAELYELVEALIWLVCPLTAAGGCIAAFALGWPSGALSLGVAVAAFLAGCREGVETKRAAERLAFERGQRAERERVLAGLDRIEARG